MKYSQPLDPKVYKKLGLDDDLQEAHSEGNIKSQRIGEMFDDLLDNRRKRNISIKTQIGWKWRRVSEINSPNQDETDRLLNEIKRYHKEINLAYQQAEKDSNSDVERLGQLLKENLYTWWD